MRTPRIRFLDVEDPTKPVNRVDADPAKRYYRRTLKVPKVLAREPRLMVPMSKPIGNVKVDATSPFSYDVAWLCNTANAKNIGVQKRRNVGNMDLTTNAGNLAYGVYGGLHGMVAGSAREGGLATDADPGNYNSAGLPLTMIFVGSMSAFDIPWGCALGTRENDHPTQLNLFSGFTQIGYHSNAQYNAISTGTNITSGVPVCAAVSLSSTLQNAAWSDGKTVKTGFDTNSITGNTSNNLRWCVGYDAAFGGRSLFGYGPGCIAFAGIIYQFFDLAMLSLLVKDPFQSLIPA